MFFCILSEKGLFCSFAFNSAKVRVLGRPLLGMIFEIFLQFLDGSVWHIIYWYYIVFRG